MRTRRRGSSTISMPVLVRIVWRRGGVGGWRPRGAAGSACRRPQLAERGWPERQCAIGGRSTELPISKSPETDTEIGNSSGLKSIARAPLPSFPSFADSALNPSDPSDSAFPIPSSMPRGFVGGRVAEHLLRAVADFAGDLGGVRDWLAMASPARCRSTFTAMRHSPTSSSWLPPTSTMASVIALHFSRASSPS